MYIHIHYSQSCEAMGVTSHFEKLKENERTKVSKKNLQKLVWQSQPVLPGIMRFQKKRPDLSH